MNLEITKYAKYAFMLSENTIQWIRPTLKGYLKKEITRNEYKVLIEELFKSNNFDEMLLESLYKIFGYDDILELDDYIYETLLDTIDENKKTGAFDVATDQLSNNEISFVFNFLFKMYAVTLSDLENTIREIWKIENY